jgi:hypothetical protein
LVVLLRTALVWQTTVRIPQMRQTFLVEMLWMGWGLVVQVLQTTVRMTVRTVLVRTVRTVQVRTVQVQMMQVRMVQMR